MGMDLHVCNLLEFCLIFASSVFSLQLSSSKLAVFFEQLNGLARQLVP